MEEESRAKKDKGQLSSWRRNILLGQTNAESNQAFTKAFGTLHSFFILTCWNNHRTLM
jgi:hypothetical protein